MMNFKAVAKNASVAFLAQGVSMCVSILTTLLVPKVLGIEEYGYWQLFIFYSAYVGFCHLGLNDGVYLVHGGEKRDEIDKRSITSQMLVGVVFQTLTAAIVIIAVFSSEMDENRSFILTCIALFMVLKNTALYLGFVFQTMNETKLYSMSCILERFCFLVPLIVLLAVQVRTFELYILVYLASTIVQLLFCLWYARDFLCGGIEKPSVAVGQAIGSVRVGVKLMLANIASQLVLGIARFTIDASWGIETFGKLSLALSMVNFFLSFVSQASMVLFPALRQGDADDQLIFYKVARDGMSLLFPLLYLLYFPIKAFLITWLPSYSESIPFFILLLPVCVFDSRMNISCSTLFKVRREESELFAINLASVAVSLAAALIGTHLFNSVYAVIVGGVLAIIMRSCVSEHLLSNRLETDSGLALTLGEILLTAVFVVSALSCSFMQAIILFSCSYAIFFVMNRDRATDLLHILKLGQTVK